MSPAGASLATIRVGVIGAGRQADNVHLPCLHKFPDVQVTAMCDIDSERLKLTASHHSVQELYVDFREMLQKAPLDAVYVLTSPHFTFEPARAVLEHGLDLFLEKPPGMNSDETAELLDVAERKGCKAMVGFNRRFSPLLNQAKRLVENEGPLAAVVSEFHTFNEDYWRALKLSEQSLKHFVVVQTIHAVDLVRYLAGDMVEIHAFADRHFGRYDDSFAALMKSDRGISVNLISNFTTSTRLKRVGIYSKRISAWLEGPEPRRPRFAYAFEWAKVITEGMCQLLTNPTDDDIKNAGFWYENQYFIECLRTGRKPTFPAADLADALKTMLLVEAINLGRKARLM